MGQCFSILQQVINIFSEDATGAGQQGGQDVDNDENGTGSNLKYPQIINHAYVTKMPDGDTITCSYKHPDGTTDTVKVRIFAIDCPELAQNYGPEAKQIGQSLLLSKTVTLHTIDVDRYGRLVADVITDTGINYAQEMLRKGCAFHYKQYDKTPELAQLEEDARRNRVGLWSYPRPQPPWEYRRKKRNRLAAAKKKREEEEAEN